MRVAVRHTDEEHPNGQWFAFGEGRLVGFTNPITGESYTPEQMADALLKRAQEQFPESQGYEHHIETLHAAGVDDDGHEIGEWHEVNTSDLPLTGQGRIDEYTLDAAQGQKESTI